jgi:hypothetical protein
MLGVIGEYLGRVYDEVRMRPLYVVSSRVGFSEMKDVLSVESWRLTAGAPLEK